MAESSSNRYKTLLEKEKLLVLRNFFSHNVFKRLVSQRHQKVSLCGNGLTLYQTTIFRQHQIESNCRRQNKCTLKTELLFGMGRKHCGKRRKCWVTSIFSFSHNVFISSSWSLKVRSVVKTGDCNTTLSAYSYIV